MLSIGKLAAGSGAASYYLQRVGCPLDYYVGRGEAPGRWLGSGAEALGLRGRLDSKDHEAVLQRLLAGRAPDGRELVKPVLRGDPRGRVPADVVVRAVLDVADARNLEAPALLRGATAGPDGSPAKDRSDGQLSKAWQRTVSELERARRRPRWPAPTLSVDIAQRMLHAAGLDPRVVLTDHTPIGRVRDVLARALRYRDERVDVRLPGLDLTFSAPKSVSVLWALAEGAGQGQDAGSVEEQVRAAHRLAVAEALAHLELHCSTALRGHHHGDGTDSYVDTAGLIGAAFEHRSSRCGDPQLHTHVVVANLLHGHDGKWSALPSREVYTHARTAGFVYQAVLRGEMTRRLGVMWGPVRNGQAEIAGMPGGLLRLFSKRRQQIEQRLAQLGLDSAAAAQAATLDTRPAKSRDLTQAGDPAAMSVLDRWRSEAHAAGFPHDLVQRVLHQPEAAALTSAAPLAAVALGKVASELTEDLLAPSGLTNKRASFTRREVLRGVCEQLPAGLPIRLSGLRSLATRVVRDARVVPLLGDAPVQNRRYSTRELLTVESHALELATQQTANSTTAVHTEATPTLPLASSQPDRFLGVVSPALLTAARQDAQQRGCSPEQQQMVQRLLTSGAGVEVVVGAAGSGKTTALAIAAQAWQRAGVTVHGAALAAIAARVLQDSAGIPSRSLQRLLNQLDPAPQVGAPPPGQLLPPGSVLIVDEAGMVGSRTLHQLLSLSVQQRFKLVLVGDPQQLPEIEAGGLFATFAARLPSIDLLGNQRQQQAWEQRALRELRTGDPLRAVGAYARRGRLHVTDTLDELTDRLLTDYERQLTEHDPEQVLVIASSRGDARRLNAQIRQRLLAHGHLGEDELRIELPERDGQSLRGERRYRQGDQVLVTVNDYPHGLLNGTRGTVTALHQRACAVTVRLEDGRTLRLEQDYLKRGHLVHGYALTAHKAQGVTVDVAMLWGTQALTRETGYVALSRGRQANHLYTTWDLLQRDLGPAEREDLDRPRASLRRPDPATQRRLARAALVERLEATGRQRTARSWWRRNTKSQPGARSAERAS